MINISEIQGINKIFADGKIINNSIYYAIEQKSVRDKISHILRSLVIDHTFSDGNKNYNNRIEMVSQGLAQINT